MKKVSFQMASMMGLIMLILALAGCATTGGSGGSSSKIADRPADLPKGAEVKVMRSMGDEVIIGIAGVDILRVEVYGRDIKYPKLTQEGEWQTFSLPKGRWFNFIFLNPADGLHHFVYVTAEDARMPPAWMDKSITTFEPAGWGAAMTAKEFIK